MYYSNDHRRGADGTRMFVCGVCRRVELSSYDGWLYHIGTREHQVNLYKSGVPRVWKNQRRANMVEVSGIMGLKAGEMLEFLGTWGEIEDFNYAFRNKGENGQTGNCHCIFRDRESVQAIMGIKDHKVGSKKVIVSYF